MGIISEKCFKCNGSGIWLNITDGGEIPVNPCPVCNGTGKTKLFSVDLPDGVVESYEVLQATDQTEYNSLTDAQKSGYALLLSCGKVDLGQGKFGRQKIVSWFGSESQTVANVSELIS